MREQARHENILPTCITYMQYYCMTCGSNYCRVRTSCTR